MSDRTARTSGARFAPSFGGPSLVVAFTLVLAPRLAMIVLGDVATTGDARVYLTVATNIATNFCVSISDPSGGACIPHWGGNQLPGYPAFAALVFFIAGSGPEWIAIAQSAVFAAATVILGRSLSRSGVTSGAKWAVIAVLATSPSLLGWSRSILTETLAVAAAILLLSVLIDSFARRSLAVLPCATVMVFGIFIRYDFALAFVPVATAALMIHGWIPALRRVMTMGVICLLPLGLWQSRCIASGLPPIPPFGLAADGTKLPSGMQSWIGTWLYDQYDLPTSIWALVHYDYRSLQPPNQAYRTFSERRQVETLLADLRRTYRKRPPPPEIDQVFSELARQINKEDMLRTRFLLPLKRSAAMWLSPVASMGWPAETDTELRNLVRQHFEDGNVTNVLRIGTSAPARTAMKAVVGIHRYVLLVGALILAAAIVRRRPSTTVTVDTFIGILALVFAATRTVCFSQTILVETRYLVPALAWLDVALALLATRYVAYRRSADALEGRPASQ
jgi:hypothetical protein